MSFESEIEELFHDRTPVELTLSKLQAWSVMVQLQVGDAVDHDEPTARIAEQVTRMIQAEIATGGELWLASEEGFQ